MATNEEKEEALTAEIDRESSYLLDERAALRRTEQMYPPDGGGHGFKWREKVRERERTLDGLRKERDEIRNAPAPIFEQAAFEAVQAILVPDFEAINAELIEYLGKHPHRLPDLHWRQFELLLQRVFANQGYDTEVGPGGGDQGVDLRLIQKDGVGEIMTLVQAKKYAKRPIQLEAVLALYGAVEVEDANRGLFVTTSRYLPGVMKFAEAKQRRIVLADSEDVARWCRRSS